jgi:hypothetical protein
MHIDTVAASILKYIADNTTERRLVTSQQIKLGLLRINANSVPNTLNRLLNEKLIFMIPKNERDYGFGITAKGVEALREAEIKLMEYLAVSKGD